MGKLKNLYLAFINSRQLVELKKPYFSDADGGKSIHFMPVAGFNYNFKKDATAFFGMSPPTQTAVLPGLNEKYISEELQMPNTVIPIFGREIVRTPEGLPRINEIKGIHPLWDEVNRLRAMVISLNAEIERITMDSANYKKPSDIALMSILSVLQKSREALSEKNASVLNLDPSQTKPGEE